MGMTVLKLVKTHHWGPDRVRIYKVSESMDTILSGLGVRFSGDPNLVTVYKTLDDPPGTFFELWPFSVGPDGSMGVVYNGRTVLERTLFEGEVFTRIAQTLDLETACLVQLIFVRKGCSPHVLREHEFEVQPGEISAHYEAPAKEFSLPGVDSANVQEYKDFLAMLLDNAPQLKSSSKKRTVYLAFQNQTAHFEGPSEIDDFISKLKGLIENYERS